MVVVGAEKWETLQILYFLPSYFVPLTIQHNLQKKHIGEKLFNQAGKFTYGWKCEENGLSPLHLVFWWPLKIGSVSLKSLFCLVRHMLGPRGLQPHRQTFLGVKIIKLKSGRCSSALLCKNGIMRSQKKSLKWNLGSFFVLDQKWINKSLYRKGVSRVLAQHF